MAGRPRGSGTETRPGERFGPWEVLRAGLRLWVTASNPLGHVAAECQCTCGRTRHFRQAQLPALARESGTCTHRRPGRKPDPAVAARRQAEAAARETRIRARHAVPGGWHDMKPPPAPPAPRQPRPPPRPAAPAVPVSRVVAGVTIGEWEVTQDGRRLAGRAAVQVTCTTCRRTRVVARLVLAAGKVRRCRHGDGPQRAYPAPVRDRVRAWCHASPGTGPVGAADVAAGTGITRDAAAACLAKLAAAGDLTRHWPGAYSRPGAGPFTRPPARAAVITGQDLIVKFLAADGGGTLSEIEAATGLPHSTLNDQLRKLAAGGVVVRQPDIRGSFWLLPGQEPGQVLALAG